MNERINQLMGQTLNEKFAGTWSVQDLQDLTKFADRFAELIVGECAHVLLQWKNEPFPFDEDVAVSLIKEHFGVKE
jgi:hypothetical protein